MSLHYYIWIEQLEGKRWQLQGVDLMQESHAWFHGHLTKQQQKIHGMKIQLFLAKNVIEQPGKESRWVPLGYIILAHVKDVIVSICIA
ncbi:hypothetical protein K492DRAFT_196294 [Lichtheimia hyalospora FSU 10163]|nr:hypothetical protein K492DRAFT_196294 [Lichtheimia hyalospora FSU 10163]